MFSQTRNMNINCLPALNYKCELWSSSPTNQEWTIELALTNEPSALFVIFLLIFHFLPNSRVTALVMYVIKQTKVFRTK